MPVSQSMQDLLASVIAGNDKAASEINPPTASPLSGKPDDHQTASEGARSAENEQENKDLLGTLGHEGASINNADPDDYSLPTTAAPLMSADETDEPAPSQSAPSKVEPGTSAPGMTLNDKVSAWTKNATELLIEMGVEAKSGQKTAGVTAPAAPAVKEGEAAQDESNIYIELAGGDIELAKMAYEDVHSQLAEAHLAGKKMAALTLDYLEGLKTASVKKSANSLVARAKRAMGDGEESVSEDEGSSDDSGSEGGGESTPPPDSAPSEPAPEAPPADPAAGGGMPPEMAGGGGGGMEDPAVIEQALQQLAADMGISVEELIAMMEGGGGAGGGDPMAGGGMPPDMGGGADPMAGGMSPDMGGGMPPEMAGGPPKMAAAKNVNAMLKRAAEIERVRKRAIETIAEKTSRGRR
jgi:hypothetical protein